MYICIRCLPWRPLLFHSSFLKTLCSEAQEQVNPAICHWCPRLQWVTDPFTFSSEWLGKDYQNAFCFTTILQTVTVGARGTEFPGHHFKVVAPVAATRSILVFCLLSLWDSSFCARYGWFLLGESRYPECSHLLCCWPPPGGKPHLNC